MSPSMSGIARPDRAMVLVTKRMYHKLTQHEYARVYSVFDPYLREPLLYAVLEGRHPGRVWVDNPDGPRAAFVWSHTECAYAVGCISEN